MGPLRRVSDAHNPVKCSTSPEDLTSTESLYKWLLIKAGGMGALEIIGDDVNLVFGH